MEFFVSLIKYRIKNRQLFLTALVRTEPCTKKRQWIQSKRKQPKAPRFGPKGFKHFTKSACHCKSVLHRHMRNAGFVLKINYLPHFKPSAYCTVQTYSDTRKQKRMVAANVNMQYYCHFLVIEFINIPTILTTTVAQSIFLFLLVVTRFSVVQLQCPVSLYRAFNKWYVCWLELSQSINTL